MASLPVNAPELANTSWVISGFSLSPLYGMGISDQTQHLDVFQPFFVKVDLPHAVKRGEAVAVQMIVYNYLEKEISAEVTLENPGGKSFTFGSKHPNEVQDEGRRDREDKSGKGGEYRQLDGNQKWLLFTTLKIQKV